MDEIWIVELEEDGAAGGYEIRDAQDGEYLTDTDNLNDALEIARDIARAQGIDHVRIANAIDLG